MAIANTIVGILIALCVIAIPAGIIVCIALAVQAKSQADPKRKKNFITWSVVSALLPFVVLFLLLSLWGLVSILTNTFK